MKVKTLGPPKSVFPAVPYSYRTCTAADAVTCRCVNLSRLWRAEEKCRRANVFDTFKDLEHLDRASLEAKPVIIWPCQRGDKLQNVGYQIKKKCVVRKLANMDRFWPCLHFISSHLADMRTRDDHTVKVKYICMKQPLAKNSNAKLSGVDNDYQPGL